RSLAATTALLVVVIAAAGTYAVTGSRRSISVVPAGSPTTVGSTTAPPFVDVSAVEHPTFAIFDTPPTRVLPHRKLWLAPPVGGEDVLLSRPDADPTCQESTESTTSVPSGPCTTPQHCAVLESPPGVMHESWCEGTGNQLVGWWLGSTRGEFADGQPVRI